MADEENKEETSEEPQAEQPQDEDAQSAGPVAEDDTGDAEAPEDTPADPGREAEESAVDGEAQPSADDDPSDTPSEEADGPDAEAESSGEESSESSEVQAEASEEEPAAEAEAPEASEKADKKDKKDKKDVIPGADLEPIAVEKAEENLSAEERARLEAEEEERARREARLTGEGEEEPTATSRAPAKMESDARYLATGKRKRSIARVILVPGDGKVSINGRELDEFFPRPLHRTIVRQPLATTGYEGSVDVRVRVHGGGVGGQAGAVRHGISRALTEIDPELRGELKRRGFLTRDARVKERRKAGLKKARKRPQFSKR
jgi:small subunit ribosomal protein S9